MLIEDCEMSAMKDVNDVQLNGLIDGVVCKVHLKNSYFLIL